MLGLAVGCATEKLPTDRNRAPIANAGPDLEVELGARIELDAAESFDPDDDPLSFRWQLDRPEGSASQLDNENNVTTGFVPDVAGYYEVILVATDGALDSAPDTVRIEVLGVQENRPPVAVVGSGVPIGINTAVTLDGEGSFDPDNDPLIFDWKVITAPEGAVAELTGFDTATPVFVSETAGDFEVSLVVSDGELESDPEVVTIVVVGNENRAPIADAGANISVATGSVAELDGRNSADPEGAALTFVWSLVDKPVGSTATLSAADVPRPTLTTDVDGDYVAQLVVNDGTLDSSPDTVTIVAATGNLAPIADAGSDQGAKRGETVTLDGRGSSDPDGDALAYAWTLVTRPPGSSAALAGYDTARPTFVADLAGSYSASLVVDDGTRGSAADFVTIDVSHAMPQIEGDVVITEYMANPATVGDDFGEWFELHNPTNVEWDLNGCVLEDLGVDSHAIAETLLVPAFGYITLAKSSAPGFAPDYVYGNSFPLANSGDEIIVACGSAEIAQIAYLSTVAGASTTLLRSKIDEVQNDFDGNWCTSSSDYNGDFGTPGSPNEFDTSCP